MTATPRRLAVIGAGVSGLAAAAELGRLAASGSVPLALTVFDASSRPGGKLLTVDFAGARVDLGAESVLGRDPQVQALVAELGLTTSMVQPATTSASIWDGRRLVAIPRDTVLGVPLHPWRLDVLRAVGLAGVTRASLEPWLRRGEPDPDGPLGTFLGGRVGNSVFTRLVGPLLGGVYAGPAGHLSSGAVAPQLVAATQAGGSLLRGLRQAAPARVSGGRGTPFIGFTRGLEQLVGGLTSALPPGSLRLGQAVTALETLPGERIRLQAQGAPASEFDGLVVALPAPAAATLLSSVSGEMAALLRELEYASVATITLAYPDRALSQPLLGSGFLVRRRPRRTVTACTYLDRKWPHLRQSGLTILRASAGSFGDEWVLALDDTTLVTTVHRELRAILRLTELPAEARVERWHGSLPQYRAGHLRWRDRVARVGASLPVRVELTGAAFGGVGVAACLQAGAQSARTLWRRLGEEPAEGK
ncbi:MAG TPA: protoporphyrinogen oxidase [Candidatus Dormibacteraeota bacterium]|nr:protoporphyrinogen oxidase [Candidatus Dormibacteraeota bacterium]